MSPVWPRWKVPLIWIYCQVRKEITCFWSIHISTSIYEMTPIYSFWKFRSRGSSQNIFRYISMSQLPALSFILYTCYLWSFALYCCVKILVIPYFLICFASLFSFRDFYHDLDPVESKKWIYFEKFKMELHYQAVSNPKVIYTMHTLSIMIRERPIFCTSNILCFRLTYPSANPNIPTKYGISMCYEF